jgi:N-acetyl-1-D-myo-inositol-2-amino-2-deoxy-alpha-D-glucopyranoside deacetylase
MMAMFLSPVGGDPGGEKMPAELRLMCVLAHPDDEALGCGFTLARYAAEGVRTYLVTATRGERGWQGPPEENPGLEALGRVRERELLQAAMTLGVSEVNFLDYVDGELDQADPHEVIDTLSHLVRRIRPQVVITFDPWGTYGHPDHVAIQQFCQAALLAAADPASADAVGCDPHRVDKLYYMISSPALVKLTSELWGGIRFDVDGIRREHTPWPAWAATTQVDGSGYWEVSLDAIACHVSQTAGMMAALRRLPDTHDPRDFSVQNFYRVFSFVNGGRELETDLFAGLREA